MRLSLNSDTVASYPSFPNSFIPRLNPYWGVDQRPCRPSILLYVVSALNIYKPALDFNVPLLQYGPSKFLLSSITEENSFGCLSSIISSVGFLSSSTGRPTPELAPSSISLLSLMSSSSLSSPPTTSFHRVLLHLRLLVFCSVPFTLLNFALLTFDLLKVSRAWCCWSGS